MKNYPKEAKLYPNDYIPNLVRSHSEISDADYFKRLESILENEPEVRPDGKKNLTLVTQTIRDVYGKRADIRTEFAPEHLQATVNLTLPFVFFDAASLSFLNGVSGAIESVFISQADKSISVKIFVSYFKGAQTPHEKALESLFKDGKKDLERSFYL